MATATDNRVPADLLEILVCPVSHGALRQEGDYLVCEASDLAYPVRDGIPVMLVEEAVPYSSLRDGTGAGAGEDREAGAAEGAGA